MKKIVNITFVFLLTISCAFAQDKPAMKEEVAKKVEEVQSSTNNNMDKLSYSVGIMIAQGMKKQGLDNLNAQDLAKAIEDVIKGNPLQIDEGTASQIFQDHLQTLKAKEHEGVIKEGKEFLATNAKRPEVKTLPSGLQYEVMKEGTGAIPTAQDKVSVHYHGTLIDGTKFDSSVERGEPATFGVTQVIPGWVEALQLMKTGSKWKLFIPSDLAYGERAAGAVIKPFSTLVFEVELLEIK